MSALKRRYAFRHAEMLAAGAPPIFAAAADMLLASACAF